MEGVNGARVGSVVRWGKWFDGVNGSMGSVVRFTFATNATRGSQGGLAVHAEDVGVIFDAAKFDIII